MRSNATILCILLGISVSGSALAEQPRTALAPIQSESFTSEISPGGQVATFTAAGQPVRNILRGVRNRIWNWAKPAPHQSAAVVVRCPDGSSGSGTVIQITGGRCMIITAAHVVETSPSVSVQWRGGRSYRGSVVIRWAEPDLAAIIVPSPPSNFAAVPIAPQNPPSTVSIEVMGFGGPRFGTFRPYVASPTSGTGALCIDAPSISGDSGAGMLWGGQLVGVQFGAFAMPSGSLQGSNGPVPLVYPATSRATVETLTQFGNRACQMIGGGCQPVIGQQYQQPQSQYGGNVDQQFYPQPGEVEIQLPAPTPSPSPVDVDSLADVIAEKLASDERLRGPPGPQGEIGPKGPAGAPGQMGVPGQPGQITAAQIQQIKDEILAAIPDQSRRVVLVDGSTGKIVDDETYGPGEAITLDVQRILAAAKKR